MKERTPYKMYACLPYLNLQNDTPIGMGPIRFYPSSVFDDYIGKSEREEIKSYFENAPAINRGTCLCVHPSVKDDEIPELLVDALYMLYFSATYDELYHNKNPPHFDALTKFVPAGGNLAGMKNLESLQVKDSQVMSVDINDNLMSGALGELLKRCYLPADQDSSGQDVNEDHRIIRAIRYFIHCFYEKFENLLGTGIHLKEKIYEPEDFLFLIAAFETLFDLDPDYPNTDLKQKLRPILHVKFGTPLETIWKWIDGFFEIKNQSIHQGNLPEDIFRANGNFEISYFKFATKLFIYSTYYKLYLMNLLPAEKSKPYIPIKFKGIEREEVIAFLWPETKILRRISTILMQITHGKADEEYLHDLNMLARIYKQILSYYSDCPASIQFNPADKNDLKNYVEAIVNLADEAIEIEGKPVHLHDLMPDEFISAIEKRVA
jgi:hypothetical protein